MSHSSGIQKGPQIRVSGTESAKPRELERSICYNKRIKPFTRSSVPIPNLFMFVFPGTGAPWNESGGGFLQGHCKAVSLVSSRTLKNSFEKSTLKENVSQSSSFVGKHANSLRRPFFHTGTRMTQISQRHKFCINRECSVMLVTGFPGLRKKLAGWEDRPFSDIMVRAHKASKSLLSWDHTKTDTHLSDALERAFYCVTCLRCFWAEPAACAHWIRCCALVSSGVVSTKTSVYFLQGYY